MTTTTGDHEMNDDDAPTTDPDGPATLDTSLRIGAGFAASEHGEIRSTLQSLDHRLASFEARGTELELSVKDRGGRGQRMTLECWVAGRPRVVATSEQAEIPSALVEVRDDLRRQLDDATTRTEPRNNRHHRDTNP